MERGEVVSVTFFEVGDRVFLKRPIVFMPGALWAPVSNPTRRLGAQLKLRGVEAAKAGDTLSLTLGDILCITLQLVGCDKRYGNNCRLT